ncbi:hypothetical protein EDD90_2760 [Streptomyces sp. Ag109_O5-1]|uniref:hypothetical protein n=1 Tax=Streptomyces sp. Ag109_O5-1 TaxID=1938851 RepID=UPI000F4FB019|nr:hypothetical protein [Streptomyces sp. Ag109_O5-1]RPE39743.1 hypothetical protein EDD90_2760 [Streptomyces sp. Ag109_O5-1]
MSRLALTPSVQPKTGTTAPLNLTAQLTAGALSGNTGVSFTNTGREVLYIQSGATATIASVQIGTTIEGQAVGPIALNLHSSAVDVIGPFPTDENQANGQIYVDFTTPANVTGVALVQNGGVF